MKNIFGNIFPSRQGGEGMDLPGEGEADPERKQHGFGTEVLGSVFVVPNKGESTAGELHADLMAAAGMKTDMNKAGFLL